MIRNKFSRSLFIFRRDLRLEDNTALIEACASSESVIACFILDPRQVDPHPYRSSFAMYFLAESLEDLKKQLEAAGGRLHILKGQAEIVVEDLLLKEKIDAVFINRDYTPFSVSRDILIKKICQKYQVHFNSFADSLLHEPEEIFKNEGGPYTVFTPFCRKAKTHKVREVGQIKNMSFSKKEIKTIPRGDIESLLESSRPSIRGGRTNALDILNNLSRFKDYQQKRDFPSLDATSHLSAHHKFGTVSIREVYHEALKVLGKESTFIQELYWRDFFTHVAHYFPHVFGHSFYEEYDNLVWSNNIEHFERWCQGRTGFPIVDAGMRELNETGFMHNRVRMITASFLVKDLHIDWRWGERYFASKLVDYDPAVNNGNWQWAASTGCDHQPYFRIFNPLLQQERFDPDFVYIRRWVKEYGTSQYTTPMIDYKEQALKAVEMFKAIKGLARN